MPERVLKFIQRRAYVITCSLLFLAAVIVRILAARGDFAMDEIWSLRLVTENARSIFDIIFKIKHDNNHILNSVWMYVLGPQQAWQLYRIPAVIGGSLCVLFSFLIARRQSRAQGIAALILTGFCFPLVFYSSEARGYGLMMGFSMMALYAMVLLLENAGSPVAFKRVIFFWCAVILGFLSHLIFICTYLGLAAWSLYVFVAGRHEDRKRQYLNFILIHSIPIAFFVFLYFVFVRGISIGGGPVESVISALYKIFIVTFGVWGFESQGRWLCLMFLLLVSILIIFIRRFYGKIWVFFAVSIFCAPAFILVFFPFPFVSMRHFLPSLLLLVFALSYFVGFLWKKSLVARGIAIGLVFIFCVGQLTYLPSFLRYGRGQFSKAVEYLAAISYGRSIRISSDFDFRNQLVLDFYRERVPGASCLLYVPLALAKDEKDLPDILLIHYFDCYPWIQGCLPENLTEDAAVSVSLDNAGYKFSYLKFFPWHGILSGWSWIIFKRENAVFLDESAYSNK